MILESGKPYKLSDIFSGDRKIIIPDLQRDYCWGDKIHGDSNIELVSGFIDNLFELNQSKTREIQLGMIYAYEDPTNHIQLCDGQQRITTLFLLIGLLYKKTNNKDLRQSLISDFEMNDDKEPRLLYSIRESTLYFLSDLVCNYFINSDEDVSEIKKSSWYFSEYELDPTIQSMMSALEIIEKKLNDSKELDLNDFTHFLLYDVQLFYFDMKDRFHGEDMFVIINTTGEPLTASENLKPKLIGNITSEEDRYKKSKIWEKWEKWFWQNRKDGEFEGDQGLNQFFIWYWQIKLLQEKQWKNKKSYDISPFYCFTKEQTNADKEDEYTSLESKDWESYRDIISVDKYFEAYIEIVKEISNNIKIQIQSVLKSIKGTNVFDASYLRDLPISILLPLIEFKVLFPRGDLYPLLRRLRKNYFNQHDKYKDRIGNYVDWRHLIEMIRYCKQKECDLLKFKDNNFETNKISNVKNNIDSWYNIEEQIKDEYKEDNLIKEKLELWEDHIDFMGDITPILLVHKIDNASSNIPELVESDLNLFNSVDFAILEKYFNNYKNLEDQDQWAYNPNIANYYRLYKVIVNCNKIGHINQTSGMRGVQFSLKNREQLSNIECLKLFKTENPIEHIKQTVIKKVVSDKIFDFSQQLSSDKIITAWLSLKVFNAEESNTLISKNDGNNTGIAAYIDIAKNYIFKTDNSNFDIANCICGIAVKSGGGSGNCITYTSCDNWFKPDCIDTPFAGIIHEMFNKKDEIDSYIVIKAVEENRIRINQILEVHNITIKDAKNDPILQLSV